ncbi:protein phosphatase 2C domain-containing protein [uncultured Roseovarius sp.]|uniref:PP2C family protein-serine/threonine phosphatase n=1 Tax=uncultured Roseovarius sp. TaxID=293344 RepID=UPI00261788A9|nr:protein phosphatase 2C domain-containing protein [uncultured Roseovarius sp.]
MENSFIQRKLYNWLQRETGSSGVRKVASLKGAIASEIGNVRSDNQDKAIVFKGVDAQARDYAVAVVADGIGGMKDGAACAALAIASFTSAICELSQLKSISPSARMTRAATSANEAVYRDYVGRGGSTLVAVLFSSGMPPFWVSAGDSRIYLHAKNSLKLLTTDDTIAGQLNKSGAVPAEHSKILQFVGMGKDFEPHLGEVREVLEGKLILTTDGVHYLEYGSNWFKKIIENAPDAGATAKRLVDVAKWCGGPDNATLACLGFPFYPSDRRVIGDGIQIWDAFGELDIQLQLNSMPNPNNGIGSGVQNSDQIPSNDQSATDEIEPQLIEDDEPELLPLKRKTTPKKPRKSRAKKAESKDTPQLDIEFSKKE